VTHLFAGIVWEAETLLPF